MLRSFVYWLEESNTQCWNRRKSLYLDDNFNWMIIVSLWSDDNRNWMIVVPGIILLPKIVTFNIYKIMYIVYINNIRFTVYFDLPYNCPFPHEGRKIKDLLHDFWKFCANSFQLQQLCHVSMYDEFVIKLRQWLYCDK